MAFRRPFVFLVLAALAAGGALASGDVRAWYVSPREVREQAGLVVVGTIRASKAVPGNPTPVFTEYELDVERVLKGNASGAIKFRQTGGSYGGYTTYGEPHADYQPGQRWLVALVQTGKGWWTTWGMRHGAFRIDGAKATRDYAGFVFIDGTLLGAKRPEVFALGDLEAVMRGENRALPAPPRGRK